MDLTTSPVVQELIARGDEVVPALLNALAQDYRLTRSVSFHRDYFTNRRLIAAAEAAYAALCKISGQSFGPAADIAAGGNKRALLVKNVRAHWKEQGELATTNQMLAVLQNDNATPQQWFEAASNLFTGKPSVSSLDKQQSALVAALLAKRIESITASLNYVSGKESAARAAELLQQLHQAELMAEWLTNWNKTAALPVLRNLWKRHTSTGVARLMTIAPKAEALATLQAFPPTCILWRVKAGDMAALNDYAVWLKAQRDNKNGQESGIFEPLWRYPAQTTALAEEIFNGKTSSWNPLIDPRRTGQLNGFVAGPLLAVPAYRAQVSRQLKNWAKCGTIEIMANDRDSDAHAD